MSRNKKIKKPLDTKDYTVDDDVLEVLMAIEKEELFLERCL